MKQFIKNRWMELRIGSSSYFSYLYSFTTLVIVISLRFTNLPLPFYVGLALSIIGSGIVVGHFHLKWQQQTDVRLQYAWMIDEIVRRVKEEK